MYRFTQYHKWSIVGFSLAAYLCYLSLSIEANLSRVAHIPRSEYKRVLREIIYDTTGDTGGESTGGGGGGGGRSKGSVSKTEEVQHDSFYYLQRNLERRARRAKQKADSG